MVFINIKCAAMKLRTYTHFEIFMVCFFSNIFNWIFVNIYGIYRIKVGLKKKIWYKYCNHREEAIVIVKERVVNIRVINKLYLLNSNVMNAGRTRRSTRNISVDSSVAFITAAKANWAVYADSIRTSWRTFLPKC